MRRPSTLWVILGFLTTAGAVEAAPPAPEPFDLTYLPRLRSGPLIASMDHAFAETHALLAVRPAAIFAHPTAHDLSLFANSFLKDAGELLGAQNSNGPGIENIDTAILLSSMSLSKKATTPLGAFEPNTGLFGSSGGVVRTVRPYDWTAAVRRSYPQVVQVDYRGAVYLAIHSNEKFFKWIQHAARDFPEFAQFRMAFYCPDDRTLVFESEERIREVIDRVRERRREPPPPGWDQVERCTIALAIDSRNKGWMFAFPKGVGPTIPFIRNEFFRSVDTIVLGLDLGPRTRFHSLWFCATPMLAEKARRGLRQVCFDMDNAFGRDEADEPSSASPTTEALQMLALPLIFSGKTTRMPLGDSTVSEVPDDLLHFAVLAMKPILDDQQLMKRGYGLLREGSYKEAIALMDETLRKDSKNYEAYFIRGRAHYSQGEYLPAIRDFDEAIRGDSGSMASFGYRGRCYRKIREYDKALADFDEALRLAPDNASVFASRGLTWWYKGDLQKAFGDFDKAIELEPKYAFAYHNRAKLHAHFGRLDKTIADASTAIRLQPDDPDNWDLYYIRGQAHSEQGRDDQAIRDFTESIRLNPDQKWAHLNRGIARRNAGDLDGAIADCTEAIRRNPVAEAYSALAAAHADKKQFEQAVEMQKQALKLADTEENRAWLKRYESGQPHRRKTP